jgi:hypothetical protein
MKRKAKSSRTRPAIDAELLEDFSDDVEDLQHAVGDLRGQVAELRKLVEAQIHLAADFAGKAAR